LLHLREDMNRMVQNLHCAIKKRFCSERACMPAELALVAHTDSGTGDPVRQNRAPGLLRRGNGALLSGEHEIGAGSRVARCGACLGKKGVSFDKFRVAGTATICVSCG
jgi:hypothetical protein